MQNILIIKCFSPLLSSGDYLSNSSIQQSPPSARTRAPASNIHSPANKLLRLNERKEKSVIKDETQEVGKRLECLPPSFTAVTVNPALVLPSPVVITALLLNFAANFKN